MFRKSCANKVLANGEVTAKNGVTSRLSGVAQRFAIPEGPLRNTATPNAWRSLRGEGCALKLVVGQGMVMVAIAVGVGLVGALATGTVLASLLFDVSPHDPLTYGAVTGTLVLVALLACWLPARRASSVSPQTALRSE